MPNPKLKSLSIFFPFYNDAGTVPSQIESAFEIAPQIADEYEIIAIHGGPSKDDTWDKISEMKRKFPELVVVDKKDNKEGYAVIKHGFKAATKDWVFYTDGDAQYYLEDIHDLFKLELDTGADIVNGFKAGRKDNIFRVFFGEVYRILAKKIFKLPIRDLDCDFRLMRNDLMKQIEFESKDAGILTEMIVKLNNLGATFVETPVRHRERAYGTSNYTALGLTLEKLRGDWKVYKSLKRWESELKSKK